MKKQYLHFVITRFNIPARYAGRRNPAVAAIDPKTDEAYLDGRMALFEKYTFPSLAGQTNKEFKWLVLFSDQTPQKYVDRLNQLKKGNDWFCPLYLKDEEAYDFDHYLAGVIGQYEAENYIITRIDNDDAMSIKTVERLQTYCREHQTTDTLISFRYGYQYTEHGGVLAKQNIFGNHFISLVYSSADKTIISFPHNHVPEEIKQINIGTPEKPMWIEIIHGTNYANQTFFNIKNMAVSQDALEEYVCDIPWGKKDVLRNMVKSIGGTFRCVWQVIKKKS